MAGRSNLAFFDRVTSSVQKLTRRVGGGISSGQEGQQHETDLAEGGGEGGDDSIETSGSQRMDNRNPTGTTKNSRDDWRRRETELQETFRRKLDAQKQRWQQEKSKEMDALVTNLRKKHDSELEIGLKTKDKELKVLKTQLRKSQEQLLGRSRSGLVSNAASQDSIKSSRSQDYSHSRGRTSAELANMREQISEMQQTIKRNEYESKRKEADLRTLRDQHDAEIQRMARDAQRHIKALLEESQQKERRIEKLERQLRLSENQLSNFKSEEHNQLKRGQQEKSAGDERQHQISTQETAYQQVVDMKLASSSSSMSSSRLGLASSPFNTIAKDEYEKEKQRWQQRTSELEASLKKSEDSNADLAQGKAEMIRKNKDLEKAKKSLEEWNKKLSDRQKVLNQESKVLEQKLKEAQDETIRATQACETVTLECNRLKEKRYNPDRDEELERLRQQNLEYCKCISALKQTILEKDRRLEVLQHKLRRSKRCRATIAGLERSDDENTRSVNDLDFTASSMSLDTINEDYAEATKEELEVSYRQLANEHLELQNICNTLMRQANSEGSQDLRIRLQEALHKIVQLEKNSPSFGFDSGWSQEKLRYASLIRAMGEKIHYLETNQERLQQELGSAKEENELLEFQVLELEHSQNEDLSACSTSNVGVSLCKSLCDRSVSTSEDEGHFSMDHSIEENVKELSLEELKIRLTLLKHRKELRPDDRLVVAQVKELWESLQNEHAHCGSKFIECELKIRELETLLREQSEAMQLETQDLSTKEMKKLKAKELQRELESVQELFSKLQEENAFLKNEMDAMRSDSTQLRSIYATCSESEQRERQASETLRKQLDDLATSRKAEIEILEQASRQQAQTIAAMRTKIADLEQEIDHLNQQNRSPTLDSLPAQLPIVVVAADSKKDELESDRLRKMNSEYQESLSEYKKLESCWQQQRQQIERKYSDVKTKFKEAMSLIKEYEQTIAKYGDRLKDASKEKEEIDRLLLQQKDQIIDLERQIDLLQKSAKPTRDDFMACKEVEEQLKAMLKEKSHELEEKSILERRLLDEKSKLQKQAQHSKSYSAQLESQFEMQIQIVQALKGQILELQSKPKSDQSIDTRSINHLDSAHRLFSLFFPSETKSSRANFWCCQMQTNVADEHWSRLEIAAKEIWENIFLAANSKLDNSDFDFHKACVKLHSVKNELAKLDEKSEPMEVMAKLCSAMLFYCERLSDLRSKMDELENNSVLCKEAADKANVRAELLQKQFHEALVKPVELAKGQQETRISTSEQCEAGNVQVVLERICKEIKDALEKITSRDSEALNAFRSRVAQLVLGGTPNVEEDGLRTVSPLEHCGSGTESELCDRSPLLSRKRRSVEVGGGGGSFRSSSSDDADMMMKTTISKNERKAKVVDDASGNPSPPSNVRLAADLRNGRYLICWSPPEIFQSIQGYKIYVKDVMRKYVASAHSTKAVIECGTENDWMFINVRTVGGEKGSWESAPTSIDVERSKKFVQNTMLNDSAACKNAKRRTTCESHDENDDEEECSEV